MRITLRLILALTLTVAVVASLAAYFQAGQERKRQQEDLIRRSRLLSESLQEALEPMLERNAKDKLQRLVERFGNRERLVGIAVYDPQQKQMAVTNSLAASLVAPPPVIADVMADDANHDSFHTAGDKHLYIHASPLHVKDKYAGALILFHDTSFIKTQVAVLWRNTFLRVIVQMVLISLVTLLIVQWSLVGPIAKMAEWMKQLRAGETPSSAPPPKEILFAPIAKEATRFARHLSDAKAAAEEEARLRQTAESLWTPERLREHVRSKLQGKPLFVVSNREPYMHVRRGRKIDCIVPAGGLVTALEPVMRASGGTWISHGAGDADWEVTDSDGRIKVPPEDPQYTLRRVALTKEEETGYYYGFSNEGLWPLCHIAHTRPLFRASDWEQYQSANRKFAQAVMEELRGIEEPCVLIQDYHFALLPRLLKQERPDARIASFWHIPWPNPEAFGICPWQKDLLYGMLGADLIGFHTQFHCNNFLDTVDRTLESRIDWERFGVNKEGHTTLVKPFPISVAFPDAFQDARIEPETPLEDRAALLKELGIKAKYFGVGVERMDYTKGVLERFRGIERFLEKNPRYQGEFVFIQIGAPSRTHIKRYHDFLAEVEEEAERINWKFKAKDYRPIVFLKKHHSHREILPFYKSADVCMVTSLHDGMNLVAKEFVAARNDESGVLILSRFAGASRELRDALIVNPYDAEQLAEAIRFSLEMDPSEKESRMKRMRATVREHNIYRWAGNLIEELTKLQPSDTPTERRRT
ncbi:MAG TPA: trehalose-6-phosphate synthase [Elusimicrobiota bacterium]|nr:trehalose-6-phosphate synthase [Elusimicrobiota bacterium]